MILMYAYKTKQTKKIKIIILFIFREKNRNIETNKSANIQKL